jgi:hypothetical protein
MIYEILAKIQRELKAPKNQFNAFGKYNYRSCEDILEAVKPMLNGLVLILSDEVVQIGDRYYVKATASLASGGKDMTERIANTAFAREEDNRKGMDSAQLTGATSSYARKYALAGLFLLDDNKDADATNDHGKGEKAVTGNRQSAPESGPPPDGAKSATKSADDLKREMSKWFEDNFGEDALIKFKEMTKGIYDNPLTIPVGTILTTVYKHFIAYKESHDA